MQSVGMKKPYWSRFWPTSHEMTGGTGVVYRMANAVAVCACGETITLMLKKTAQEAGVVCVCGRNYRIKVVIDIHVPEPK